MLEFLRREKAKSDSLPIIYYKNGEAFFQSQCEFGHTALVKNTAVVALVLDAQQKFGTPTPISVGQDGAQLAALRVASLLVSLLQTRTYSPPSCNALINLRSIRPVTGNP